MLSDVSNQQRAKILLEALPYIRQYKDQILVVKYGGNAMLDEELKAAVMGDLVLLSMIGVRVVLVHGGGPEISDLMQRVGKTTEFVNGLRVTDAETAEIAQMVLAGKINKRLVQLLGLAGGKAIGLCGMDGGMIQATGYDERLGFVGEVTAINTQPILDVLGHGYIPVIATTGCDDAGNIWNINADIAAAQIAGALRAKSLIMMTDTRGILSDPKDQSSLISVLRICEAPMLMRREVITGGMIPKVESCIAALQHGVEHVFIIDGRVPHAILIETLTEEGLGTMIVKE